MGKSIKCLNRADFGNQMEHLKISKKSSRRNIYLTLDITDDAIVCQNRTYSMYDLCQKERADFSPCQLKNGETVSL